MSVREYPFWFRFASMLSPTDWNIEAELSEVLKGAEAHWAATAEASLAIARQADDIDEWKRAMAMASAARGVASHLFYARCTARNYATGNVGGYPSRADGPGLAIASGTFVADLAELVRFADAHCDEYRVRSDAIEHCRVWARFQIPVDPDIAGRDEGY